MKTRLLWLGILCLALLFALGLLVVGAEMLPQPPPRAQFILPPASPFEGTRYAADSGVDKLPSPYLRINLPAVCPMIRHLPASDANGTPLTGGSYADSAFAAFHFSDEAG